MDKKIALELYLKEREFTIYEEMFMYVFALLLYTQHYYKLTYLFLILGITSIISSSFRIYKYKKMIGDV